jgi:hypothetical protein
LRRRHAVGSHARLSGGKEKEPSAVGDFLYLVGRLHFCRRSQGFHRRGAGFYAGTQDAGARFPRRLEDGHRVQHAALERPDLALGGLRLDLRKVKIPIYNLATREDHIAPAKSVLHGSKYFGGPAKFVLAGSGHIAGVINPPDLHKYQYWTGPEPIGSDVDKWLAKATEHAGSWWPDWLDWLNAQDSETVPARAVGSSQFKPIEDAPGSYVKIRS